MHWNGVLIITSTWNTNHLTRNKITIGTSYGLIQHSGVMSPLLLPKSFCNCLTSISNLLKVSYCCTQKLSNIIKSRNKKLINYMPCNCRKKEEYPLKGKCSSNDWIYKCIASATSFPNKVSLGNWEFKKRFYNHNTSFENETKRNDITLAKYVWDLKLKHNVRSSLKWHF